MHSVVLLEQLMTKGFVQLSVTCKPWIFLYHIGSYATCKNGTSPDKISMPQEAHLTWLCKHMKIKNKSALNLHCSPSQSIKIQFLQSEITGMNKHMGRQKDM
jgi:hypothetical protein